MKRELEAGNAGTFYTPLRASKRAKAFSPAPSTGTKPIEEAFESWFMFILDWKKNLESKLTRTRDTKLETRTWTPDSVLCDT